MGFVYTIDRYIQILQVIKIHKIYVVKWYLKNPTDKWIIIQPSITYNLV